MTSLEPGELPPEKAAGSEEYKFPAKTDGPSYRGADEPTVVANLFEMRVDEHKIIHKYRIDMVKVMEAKKKESDITKGPKNDSAKQLRRRVAQSIFYDMLNFAAKEGDPICEDRYTLFYDCGNSVYSCEPLLCMKNKTADEKGKIEAKFILKMEDITSTNSKSFLGHYCTHVLCTVSEVLKFPLTLAGDMAERRETLQFLEVLTTALLNRKGDHFTYNNKVYPKTSQRDVSIGEGKVIKPGFEKNCCIGQHNGRPVALLQLDAKKSPFFTGQPLLDFCQQYLNMNNVEEINNITRFPKFRKLSNHLKGVVVRTLHTKDRHRSFAIAKLEDKRLKDVVFEKDGMQVTLVDYFRSQYNFVIKYPDSPVVCERKRDGFSYYPMECLEIERGQRVSNQKASSQMAERQIEQCRMSPPEMQQYLNNAWKECEVDDKNNFLAKFGVHIDARMQTTKATVLYPPKINYRNNAVECERDGRLTWRYGRDRFVRGGKIGKVIVISFDGCADNNEIRYFAEALLNSGTNQGIEIDDYEPKIVQLRSESHDRIEEFFQDFRKHQPFVIAVSPTKNDEVHNFLKAMEAKYSVVTLNVSRITFQKVSRQDKGSQAVINNLLMKVNLKARGVNFTLDMPYAFTDANRGETRINDRLLPKYRMLIGLDVSHAVPQSFADRQLGTPCSEPSVVGMSYSISGPTQLHGGYWFQEPRLATIGELHIKMMTALLDYHKEMKHLPDDIIIFRGGVSEGEYHKVVLEVAEMKKSFVQLAAQCSDAKNYNPSIQAIVVQTNSNFRVIPKRIQSGARPVDQNVRPGTCIDHTITNPAYSEFILVGQKGLMGTVRPIRCVVVFQEQGTTGHVLSFEDIKILTHMLCYGHQVVAGSTTLPCLLTSATNLSKRGRNNWKAINFRDGSDAFSSGSEGFLRHDGSPDFFQRMSQTVGSLLTHHYWA